MESRMKVLQFRAGQAVAGLSAACFAVGVLLAPPCHANEEFGRPFQLYKGMGSCRAWIEARAHPSEKLENLKSYALGFATGFNRFNDDQHGTEYHFDNDYLFSRVDVECAKAPQIGVTNAVQYILKDEMEKAAAGH
jgi:hypothetical protein